MLPVVIPHLLELGGVSLCRVPYFWEDDIEMFKTTPSWCLSNAKYSIRGLKIFNFHPVHIVLNTPKISLYEELKSKYLLEKWTSDLVKRNRCGGDGTNSLFSGFGWFRPMNCHRHIPEETVEFCNNANLEIEQNL